MQLSFRLHTQETFSVDLENVDVRERLIATQVLKKDPSNQKYYFMHRLFLEYFVAEFIVSHVHDLHKSLIEPKHIVQTQGVIKFLTELTELMKLHHPLFKLIDASKNDSTFAQQAATAITWLNSIKTPFSHKNLQNICVPGAILTHGIFESTDLRGADLSDAKLDRAYLGNAVLDGAQLKNVDFGVLPYIQGHEENIDLIQISSDGQFLATVSNKDHVVKVWDLTTSDLNCLFKQTIKCNINDEIILILFDHTKKLNLGIVLQSQQEFDFNIAHPEEMAHCKLKKKQFIALQIMSVGIFWTDSISTRMMQFSSDQIPKMEIVHSNSMIKSVILKDEQLKKNIRCFAFSPDGTLCAAGYSKNVHIWNTSTGESLAIIDTTAVTESKLDLNLISVDELKNNYEVDRKAWIKHNRTRNFLSFSPENKWLLLALLNIHVINLAKKEIVHIIRSYDVRHLCFSPDGQWIFGVGGPLLRTFKIIEIENKYSLEHRGHYSSITAMKCSKKYPHLISGDQSGRVAVCDLKNNKILSVFSNASGFDESVRDLCAGGSKICVATGQNVLVWDYDTNTVLIRRAGEHQVTLQHGRTIGHAIYHPTQDIIVSVNWKTAIIWDVQKDKQLAIWDPILFQPVCFTPNGAFLMSEKGYVLDFYDFMQLCPIGFEEIADILLSAISSANISIDIGGGFLVTRNVFAQGSIKKDIIKQSADEMMQKISLEIEKKIIGKCIKNSILSNQSFGDARNGNIGEYLFVFSKNGDFFVTVSSEGIEVVNIENMKKSKPIAVIQDACIDFKHVNSIVLGCDDALLFIFTKDQMFVYQFDTCKRLKSVAHVPLHISVVKCAPNRPILLMGCSDGMVFFWNISQIEDCVFLKLYWCNPPTLILKDCLMNDIKEISHNNKMLLDQFGVLNNPIKQNITDQKKQLTEEKKEK